MDINIYIKAILIAIVAIIAPIVFNGVTQTTNQIAPDNHFASKVIQADDRYYKVRI